MIHVQTRSLKTTRSRKEIVLNARIDRLEAEHDRIAEAQASPEGYALKPGDRHVINDLVDAYDQLESYLINRDQENQVIPDHPLVMALGKALCINDQWGAVQIIGQLVADPPEFLKKIWWRILPPKKDQRKPKIAKRAKIKEGRVDPPLDPMLLNPMPDIGLPVASDFHNANFGSGFSPAPSELFGLQALMGDGMADAQRVEDASHQSEEGDDPSEIPDPNHDPP